MSENYWTTTVSVGKSESKIRDLIHQFGATKYAFMEDWEEGKISINFVYNGYPVHFALSLERLVQTRLVEHPWNTKRRKSEEEYDKDIREQAKKVGMRVLAHHLKAAFLAIEYGLIEFEDMFLSKFVTRDGKTIGDKLLPQLRDAIMDPGRMLGTGRGK